MDQDKTKNPEISSQEEMRQVFEQRREAKSEKKSEISSQEREKIKEELRREIEMMDVDENLKKESESKARQISSFATEEALENLLKIAKEKGVIFALGVAKKMNDPFILDTFHDLLVREGLYKNFKN